MSLLSEFKSFALRGNVVDLAVGVVIGAAFGKIVTSLVENIIMPPIGVIIGGVDFSAWKISLTEATVDAAGKVIKPATDMGVGVFLNSIIQFAIIAFAIFMVIKAMNRVMKREEAAPAAPPADIALLTEIRDLLKKNQQQ
jgi:large conductance mechanosensitive channel